MQGVRSRPSPEVRRQGEEGSFSPNRKGVSLEKLKEEAKKKLDEENAALREALRRQRETEQAQALKEEAKSSSAPRTPPPAASARTDSSPVKPLASILALEKILDPPHTAEQIAQIWTAYHDLQSGGTGRGFVSASIPQATYEKMLAIARRYPTFIIPLPRLVEQEVTEETPEGASTGVKKETAYEFFLLQWDLHDAPPAPTTTTDIFARPQASPSPNPPTATVIFTPLQEYKLRQQFATPYLVLTQYTDLASSHGTVLLRGEITPSTAESGKFMLSQEDARSLTMAIQKFYLWDQGKKENLLQVFHERPQDFKWEELLRQVKVVA
ncbi:ATP11 protein-domain-containing protein [Schizophyllum amplum]|uniref:ATP11 protein-domain-containing protein n=1 Tax=Schizophyllum amplum TaxID=97359 RepID=A0A550C2G5_9AGAR|nr:ATP11 protein-domain-containing protein [Auriculariopsis ampla]